MRDDPSQTVPMAGWEFVHAVDGIAAVLEYLHTSGRRCILATSADVSTESQIRAALGRVDLDCFFERIYSTSNTGLPKGEEFYRLILADLKSDPAAVAMVGDSFQKDVLIPNRLGMFAVWFNPRSAEKRESDMHTTANSMQELLAFWESLDRSDG
jgi:FMN phosphatase YigB (HAD superfamily)